MPILDRIKNWFKRKWEELDKPPEWLVTREAWGARPPVPEPTPEEMFAFTGNMRPLENLPEYLPWPLAYLVVHSTPAHLYADPGDSREAIVRTLREIQDDDMDDKGWEDIGYNFMIGGDGYVYEGRGWCLEGAHADGYNDRSIGVAFVGDYSEKSPKEEVYEAARKLLEEGMRKGYLSRRVKVVTHEDVSQEGAAKCPAQRLKEEIREGRLLVPRDEWAQWGWVWAFKHWLNITPDLWKEYIADMKDRVRQTFKYSIIKQMLCYIWYN